MSGTREKVVVAMSGGVDSSVAACLLVEQGYDVIGLFMRVGVEEASPRAPGTPGLQTPPAEEALLRAPGTPGLPAPTAEVGSSPPGMESSPPAGVPIPPGRVSPAGQGSATRVHQGCCSASDAADARFVAGMLEVPFYALNFKADFDRIIDYFADEYVSGRTPNPCVVCNDRLKFGKLVDYADAVGAKYIATGHYARIGERDGKTALLRGRDTTKDQSYVLFGLDRAILDRVLFPVGELSKSEVREIAARLNLPNRDKPDSVDICFVPDRDYARVVRERRPEAFFEGNVLDHSGGTIGTHKGIGNYTIGQRRGLGIAAGKPIYVTRLDVDTNTVTMGEVEALLASSLSADRVNLLADVPCRFRATVKIRYLHSAAPATVELLDERRISIRFDQPQRAITPGQAVVFYDGDTVLGGGWIEGQESKAESQKP